MGGVGEISLNCFDMNPLQFALLCVLNMRSGFVTEIFNLFCYW